MKLDHISKKNPMSGDVMLWEIYARQGPEKTLCEHVKRASILFIKRLARGELKPPMDFWLVDFPSLGVSCFPEEINNTLVLWVGSWLISLHWGGCFPNSKRP